MDLSSYSYEYDKSIEFVLHNAVLNQSFILTVFAPRNITISGKNDCLQNRGL
jgi:hypothetical protein